VRDQSDPPSDPRQSHEAALLARARAVAQLARLSTQRGDPMAAMLALLEVLPDPVDQCLISNFFWAMLALLKVLPDPDRGDGRRESPAALAALLEAYLANRELRAFDHGRAVLDAAFTAAGPLAVIGAGDGTLEVWNLAEPDAPRWRIAFADRAELGAGTVNSQGRHLAHDAKEGKLDLKLCADGKALAIGRHGSLVLCQFGNGELRFVEMSAGSKGMLRHPLFSPDGRHLVANNDYDGKSRLWRLDGAEPRKFLLDATGAEHRGDIGFSADGRRLAGRTSWGGAIVWDLAQDEPVATVLKGPSRDARVAAFSADGNWLASGDADGTTLIWNVAQPNKPFATLKGHRARISAVAISRDGRMVATADGAGAVRLSILGAAGFESALAGPHDGAVDCLAFSPDGSRFASGGQDGTVRLWSTMRNPPQDVLLRGDHRPVVSVAFSPGGRTVLARGESPVRERAGSVRLWHAGAEPAACTAFSAHPAPIRQVACDRQGRHLATIDDDGTLRVWDILQPTPRLLHEEPKHPSPRAVHFAPDGRWFALRGRSSALQLRRIDDTGVHAHPPKSELAVLRDAAFSPDSRVLAAHDRKGKAWLIELASGKVTALPRAPTVAPEQALQPTRGTIDHGSIVFSPDGTRLAVSGRFRGVVELWTLAGGNPTAIVLEGPAGRVSFSADGSRLACLALERPGVSMEWTTRIWDLAGTAPVVWADLVHAPAGPAPMFSRDGRFLLLPGASEGPLVWRLDAEAPARVHLPSEARDIRLFAPDTGFLFHTGWPALWQLRCDGASSITLPRGPIISAAAFGSEGRMLVTAHEDGTVWLWPLPASADLTRRARVASTRALTRIERGDLGLDEQELLGRNRGPWFVPSSTPSMTQPAAMLPRLLDDWSTGTGPVPSTARPPALPAEYRSPRALRDSFSFVMYDRRSRDGRWIAMGTDDSDIWLFDMAQQPPRLLILRIDGTVNDVAVLHRLRDALGAGVTPTSPVIRDVEFSADSLRLLSGSSVSAVWDLGGAVPRRIEFGDTEPPMFRSFDSPDGRRLVAGRRAGGQSLYDLTTDPPTARHLPGSSALIDTAWFSADGRWLLVVCSGNSVLAMMPRGRPEGMHLDPDSVRLWDLRDLDRGPAILHGHAEPLEYADFGVDGTSLLTQSEDAAKLWDLRADKPVGATITVERAAKWRAALKDAEAKVRGRSIH
jgi:WD40 repeat protein